MGEITKVYHTKMAGHDFNIRSMITNLPCKHEMLESFKKILKIYDGKFLQESAGNFDHFRLEFLKEILSKF